MDTYISQIGSVWYAYALDPEANTVHSLQDPAVSAPWSPEGIMAVGSPSPTRDAAYRKANRWGHYVGREL